MYHYNHIYIYIFISFFLKINQLKHYKMKNTITYNGKRYPTRTFEAYLSDETPEDVETLVIASSLLSDAMGDNILIDGSIEEQIDTQIYYFVDEEHFNYDAETLCLEHLDEPYILLEETI